MIFTSQHIGISIDAPSDRVYEFPANPKNLPKSAAGLARSVENVKDEWFAASPLGEVKFKFADKNVFGILDHEVTFPSSEKVYNPMRVFLNSNGSEVVFTLYQRPGMSDQKIVEDAEAVRKDLHNLKALIEKNGDPGSER